MVFVEGGDFALLGRFARKLSLERVANRADFAVVRAEGFNPERIRHLHAGMQETLGVTVSAAVIFDSDYRPRAQCNGVEMECLKHCDLATVHSCKEIENFLLVPSAIDRAASAKLSERNRRENKVGAPARPIAAAALRKFAEDKRDYVFAQRLTLAKRYERETNTGTQEEVINERVLRELGEGWTDRQLDWIGGKDAFSFIARSVQEELGVSITPASVIDAMRVDEVPVEMVNLLRKIDAFSRGEVPDDELKARDVS